jgi:hypothetical protein
LKGIIESIITGIFTGIIKGFFEGFIKRIIESIFKSFFKGINQASPTTSPLNFTIIFIFGSSTSSSTASSKGSILVSLRVIDGGFCPGNEFLTIRRGLRHIRYIFLSDRLLELGIGYRASGRVSVSFPRCRLESSHTPLLNPSSCWYNPLNNNDKPAQEDEET